MKLIVMTNKSSGSALPLFEIKKLFEQHGLVVDHYMTIDDVLESMDNDTVVAVIGGDGTISAAANKLKGTDAILAPLPGGTFNHFTKDLGIPQQLDGAIARLKVSKPRLIDVGTINGRVFLNNSSIGLYPSSVRERRRFERRIGKWPAVFVAALRTFVRLPGYDIEIDGETFWTPFVFVGNNKYHLDRFGGPVRERLDEGVLTVFMARRVSRLMLLKIAGMALIGRAHLLNEFEIRTATELAIITKKHKLSIARDGEVQRMKSPLRYKIEPRSLRILG